ncbi:unnamed protein product [Ilex paraguariensis]|uniref:Uncharacterized protein n=1 Tax=Ilex paraguariensis TaxID=185542 RepID=A0ABC8TRW6_9AQUA
MVLLKLSKFKLQLQALVSEVRELRERELSAHEQLQLSIQKQKQTEEEFNTKLTGLEAELALSNELGQKLEMKVRYLQSDNTMLENKQKELKGTINSLLQSRDGFLKSYEDSTCEMKRSIESRDRKIAVLLEKINAHLLLIGTIEKEASSVKQVVDNVQHALNDKEEVVAGLKSKLDKVSTFEMLFVEKINNLESKLRNDEDDLGRKYKIIMELEAQMEAAKFTNKSHPQIDELQKIVSAKDLIIQNLISEKKALQFELGSLGVIVKKIQDTVIQMNEEVREREEFGGKMVLLKLSKFKLQLQALVSEVRELRERELSAYEQLQLSIQKQKQTEEEFNTKLTGLEAELALSNELGQKLEMKVRYLQSDNAMLENKQKELKGTINSLLQSRDGFLKSYEDSTCEMKRSIESRDRKIAVLLEKINAHLLLIGTIEKEASSVKQVVDNVQHALNDKEEVVAGLKSKLDKVSTFEMLFVEKINNLESKLRNDEDDLGRKYKIIMELEAQMEAAKFTNKSHPQIDEISI